jgi:hypothetical protein
MNMRIAGLGLGYRLNQNLNALWVGEASTVFAIVQLIDA